MLAADVAVRVFESTNLVVLAWLVLAVTPFLPSARLHAATFKLMDAVVLLYSALYAVLAVTAFQDVLATGGAVDFGSLAGVVSLFQHRDVVLAGWTHYIAFDLFVASQCVQDACTSRLTYCERAREHSFATVQRAADARSVAGAAAGAATTGILVPVRVRPVELVPVPVPVPHWLVCLCLPVFLMAGPVGLVTYTAVKAAYTAKYTSPFPDACAGTGTDTGAGAGAGTSTDTGAGAGTDTGAGAGTSGGGSAGGSGPKAAITAVLFSAVVALCAMMQVWIFIFPATALTTIHPGNKYMAALTSESLLLPIPISLVTKYAAYPSARLLHTFPCALWATLLPLQLHPWLRSAHPAWHRRLGYLFAVTGAAVSEAHGVCATLTRLLLPWDDAILLLLLLWFLGTLYMAVVSARNRRFCQHRHWVLRHAGSGLWVAVMRLFVVGQAFASGETELGRLVNFTLGMVFGAVVAVGMSEVAVWASDSGSGGGGGGRIKKKRL